MNLPSTSTVYLEEENNHYTLFKKLLLDYKLFLYHIYTHTYTCVQIKRKAFAEKRKNVELNERKKKMETRNRHYYHCKQKIIILCTYFMYHTELGSSNITTLFRS